MLSAIKFVRSRAAASTLAALAATGGILALATTADASEPWHWRGRDRGHDRVVIVARPTPPVVISYPRPVVVTTRADVAPSELHMSAYQSQDTVIVLITGCNPSGGYTTALTGVEASETAATILMRNTPYGDATIGGPAQFSLNASIHTRCPLSTITVRVAGQVYQVPVTQVQALS